MITNIKNGNDLITIDYRLKQIRYLKNIAKHGPILFLDLSTGDVDGYQYLLKKDVPLFKKALKDDLLNNLNIRVNPKKLEIQKEQP